MELPLTGGISAVPWLLFMSMKFVFVHVNAGSRQAKMTLVQQGHRVVVSYNVCGLYEAAVGIAVLRSTLCSSSWIHVIHKIHEISTERRYHGHFSK